MGFSIHRVKLVLLYSAATITFFMTLFAVIGIVPAIPWYHSFTCTQTSVKSRDSAGVIDHESLGRSRNCQVLAIGLFVTSHMKDGSFSTTSNAKLNFDKASSSDLGALIAAEAPTNRTSQSIGGVTINTDIEKMMDVEKAGKIAFPFLLLAFIVVTFLGLVCFHHVVSETFHKNFSMGLFLVAFVFLLISWSSYVGIMANSSQVEKFCKEDPESLVSELKGSTAACGMSFSEGVNYCTLATNANGVAEFSGKDCVFCESDTVYNCGPSIGFVFAVLSSVNMLLGAGLSFVTSNPTEEE